MYIYIKKKKNVRQDEIINIKYYILRSLGGYYIRGNGQRFNTGNPFIYIKRKEEKRGGKKEKEKIGAFFFSFLFCFFLLEMYETFITACILFTLTQSLRNKN